MFHGSIICRTLKSVAVVEDGIKIRGDLGAELVSWDSYLEGDVDENL